MQEEEQEQARHLRPYRPQEIRHHRQEKKIGRSPTTSPAGRDTQASKTIAFWSYAREDDELDDGAILQLARRLSAEYALITGQSLNLFIDRTDIRWGEEWRARADNSLGKTTFLIPVLSPRYFARKECRRELQTFASNARELGVRDLVLPILYVDIPDFASDNPDELVALAARMQYEDWRTLRLKDSSDPRVRQAVHSLAQRLSVVTAARLEGGGQREELAEILAKIDGLFALLLDAVESDRVVAAQLNATHDAFSEKRRWARSRPAPVRRDTLAHEATELGHLEACRLASAKIQLTRVDELNPLIARAIWNARQHPDSWPLLEPLRESVREVMIRIIKPPTIIDPERLRSIARLTRVMRHLDGVAEHTEQAVQDANDMIQKWSELLLASSQDTADHSHR
jgi:hypothetical protein